MFGLAGAHRTGKTTLALDVAEEMKIHPLITNCGEVFKRHGIKPTANLDFQARLEIQHELLHFLDAAYRRAPPGPFIADRTPLDVLAYTLADVQRDTLEKGGLRYQLAEHVVMARKIIDDRFGGIVVVQPGIPIVAADNKAQPEPFYIAHLNAIMVGLIPSFDRSRCSMTILNRHVVERAERRQKITKHLMTMIASANDKSAVRN